MFIKRLSFEDRAAGWKLENIEFNKVSLLVGLSGAGKTRILHAITTLYHIVKTGESYNGLAWEVECIDNENKPFTWMGNFKHDESSFDERQFPLNMPITIGKDKGERNSFQFNSEKLFYNGQLLFERNEDGGICFKEKPTVKLARDKSVIHLLKEEDEIFKVYSNFKKILNIKGNPVAAIPTFALDDEDPTSLEDIQKSSLNVTYKLLLAYRHHKEIFEEIKERYIEIFPFVEDIRYESCVHKSAKTNPFEDILVLQIQEKNSTSWVYDWQLSSGMKKTLILISSIYLSAEGTVFLIDEIENSFGLNCLSEVICNVQSHINAQFIMTSHHPYIINSIDPEQWILIKRNHNFIEAEKISEKISTLSHHEKFLQLTNYIQRTEQQ